MFVDVVGDVWADSAPVTEPLGKAGLRSEKLVLGDEAPTLF